MGLATGTKLGPYEIQSPLGAGGMGEVYRARDTRLERVVAVKVLPANLSSDPSLRQRLEREAKAVSKLSHPHICTLHDIGHQNGVDFLVMELVEGETLEHRLTKGALPPEHTLRFAAQIADALAKAHKMGITHRDLKPSNIMLTKAGAKLMDFGLAKESGRAPLADVLSEMTVEQAKLTVEGTIVGTFQYMAPEQLEGKEADGRADIFALGEVIYEMATGKPAFAAKSRASLIAAILTSEPAPMTALHAMTPSALERVVKKCLAKDPDERWQSASDLAAELHWISESGSQAGVQTSALAGRKTWRRAGWRLAALLLVVMIAGGAVWWLGAQQSPRAMYFNIPVTLAANNVALSPDGHTLALVAYWDQTNKYMLWTHSLGGRGATPVPGTEDASQPFWSPDSRSIAFFSQGKLKKVDLSSGGSAQVLCDAPHGRGGAWNKDGTILFTPDFFNGLYRLSLAGGAPVQVTKPDATRFEASHRWPVFLPDGRHFLYLAANFSGHFESNEIFLGSLDSSEKRPIVSASSNFAYADPGYLLYMRDTALVAQRFDSRKYVLSGEPRTMSDEVQYFPQTDLALFGVAGKQALVTQTGRGADKSQLTWFNRNGVKTGAVGIPGGFANPSISADGRRLAFEQTDSDGRHIDIWIHELATSGTTRFTFGPGLNEIPVWSADGKRIAWGSSRKLNFTAYEKNADGSGSDREIADLGGQTEGVWDWSRDDRYILARKDNELWYLALPDRQAKPYLQPKWILRNAQFSPDAKWVAYSSNETGNWEVYVSPFPNGTSKWQVSRGGGEPRWRRDGKELFYLSGEGKMMAVPVRLGTGFEAGSPLVLFQTHLRQPISAQDVFSYDVSSDGQKFLINTKVDEPNAAPLSIILNWASEMEK
jgi:serine/threonine protein kinase/Tol biopolymer transport system component